jgi:hypothetical protein
MLDASLERMLEREDFILSSENHHRHAFLSRTQTVNKLTKTTTKNGALPPTRTGIHHASMAPRPQEARQIADGAG